MTHPARHHRAQRPRRTAATWPPTRARRDRLVVALALTAAALCVLAVALLAAGAAA
ncbi:hypothetical protein [Pseudonocardia alni]|uniref:Type VI protein secretion system component VasF n=1 Tax=Pseudonocardia alni TaxID=33907 RepID=A0A852VVA4_PSEA5|nr:hypothetical protein [Pseudonocardia antarctica]NYG00347.1 type VI protein secretion system component VasF [Pseudonocardia antarctica]